MDGNKPKAWELWYANVKFEDMNEYKDRPVLVVNVDNEICILSLKITSTPERNEWGEYDITKWKSAGLAHPSTVRCGHPINLQLKDFRRKIGDLHYEDMYRIVELLG